MTALTLGRENEGLSLGPGGRGPRGDTGGRVPEVTVADTWTVSCRARGLADPGTACPQCPVG